MEEAQSRKAGVSQHVPTNGVELGEDRLRRLLPQWETAYKAIRQMDSMKLGETEPHTIFIWQEGNP